MPAYDYSAVADIYDDFCVFDHDIDYFVQQTARVGGPVLELMSGTGRVSLPLVRAGVDLTCVDRSPPMLAVLSRKLSAQGLEARPVSADVCALPFCLRFEVVLLPFQGFTELVGEASQRLVFEEAARVLPVGGRFLCTSHNPAVRSSDIDGRWREIGRFPDAAGRELVLSLRTWSSDRPDVVFGTQTVEIFDRQGTLVESREIELEFSLAPPEKVIQLAVDAGFDILRLRGDYEGNGFDERTSPTLIVECAKSR